MQIPLFLRVGVYLATQYGKRFAMRGLSAARRPLGPGAALIAVLLVLTTANAALGQSLRGSGASLDRQNRQAQLHDFTFLRDAAHVQRFVDAGYLVPIRGDENYSLKAVSFPFGRPAAQLFIERLSAQYRRACGEQLVVTSLTRPLSNQPRNASRRSVHPTGMAIDLRRPYPGPCRDWLEDTLLYLEGEKVLDATRETSPAHYHVALYSEPYTAYVARLTDTTASAVTASISRDTTYRVRRRDTLWRISREYDTTPEAIQRANGLRSTQIYPGQLLKIPAGAH